MLMVTAVILAGGRVTGFPRHLKWSFMRLNRVIDNSIRACLQAEISTCVVCDRSNQRLIDYIMLKYPSVKIVFPKDSFMTSSFETAFSHDNYQSDKVVIAGDLLKVRADTLKNLAQHRDTDALCSMDKQWDKLSHLIGADKELKFRTDVGQGIFLISKTSQRLFLTDDFVEQALNLRRRFKDHSNFDETSANDVWTWMLFYLFDEIYDHDSGIKNKSKQILLDLKVSTANDYDPK